MNDQGESYLLNGNAAIQPMTWVDLFAAALPIVVMLLLLITVIVIFRDQFKLLRGPIFTFFLAYVAYLFITVFLWKFSQNQHSFLHQFVDIVVGVTFFIGLFWLISRLKK